MKIDRFSSISIQAAAVLLAGLLLSAGLPAAGQSITFNFGKRTPPEDSIKEVSKALARQVDKVQEAFDKNRRALRTVQGADGKPAYLRQEVTGLIAHTGKDLDLAIEQVGESRLDALRAWSADELRRITFNTTALHPSLSTPRAVAVVASLEKLSLPGLAGVNAAASPQETISAETTNGVLDQVAAVVSRIFFLAERDDLEVELWVGSTPAPKATFRFWSQGKVKGSTLAPTIVQTNSKREHVLRGLYVYKAALTKGAVTELVAYPSLASAPLASERLDLVNGSSYFCCRFNEVYCHHVADEKECRP